MQANAWCRQVTRALRSSAVDVLPLAGTARGSSGALAAPVYQPRRRVLGPPPRRVAARCLVALAIGINAMEQLAGIVRQARVSRRGRDERVEHEDLALQIETEQGREPVRLDRRRHRRSSGVARGLGRVAQATASASGDAARPSDPRRQRKLPVVVARTRSGPTDRRFVGRRPDAWIGSCPAQETQALSVRSYIQRSRLSGCAPYSASAPAKSALRRAVASARGIENGRCPRPPFYRAVSPGFGVDTPANRSRRGPVASVGRGAGYS